MEQKTLLPCLDRHEHVFHSKSFDQGRLVFKPSLEVLVDDRCAPIFSPTAIYPLKATTVLDLSDYGEIQLSLILSRPPSFPLCGINRIDNIPVANPEAEVQQLRAERLSTFKC